MKQSAKVYLQKDAKRISFSVGNNDFLFLIERIRQIYAPIIVKFIFMTFRSSLFC